MDNFDSIVNDVLLRNFPLINELSSEQHSCLKAFVSGRDVFSILPTGAGKSLIFQLAPLIISELSSLDDSFQRNPIILVVCPLNALVNSHIRTLDALNLKSAFLSDEKLDSEAVRRGEFMFVFCNPESLFCGEKWRNMLLSDVYQRNLVGIVTDEVHVVPKWGGRNKKEQKAAFRASFARLGELRTLVPNVPVLALTATATSKVQEAVVSTLCLKPDALFIRVSPNKLNIYFHVKKVGKEVSESFEFLLRRLRLEGVKTKKTIVYCKTVKDCFTIYVWLRKQLGFHVYSPPGADPLSENSIISMFHHSTAERIKRQVLDSLHDKEGKCRVVIATNALGMGCNFPDVKCIVHYGPSTSIDDYVQEVGRGGRDGSQAIALLLYNGYHLKRCTPAMKAYVKEAENSDMCLRSLLMKEFESVSDKPPLLHACCMNCKEHCGCSDGCTPILTLDLDSNHLPKPKPKSREVTELQKKLLTNLLQCYQTQLYSSGHYFDPASSSGFTDSLVTSVLHHAKYIFDTEYILNNLPVFNPSHATEILLIIKDVFEDIYDMPPCQHNLAEACDFEDEFDLNYGGAGYEQSDECSSDLDSETSESGASEGIS